MRYHQLIENVEPDYSNYSEAFDRYRKGFCIYRGMTGFGQQEVILKPQFRKSIDSGKGSVNYMTTLMSNLPEWSSYPKRNYCIIGTSCKDRTNWFGEEYYLFPENGSKIAICGRAGDIYSGFKLRVPVINDFIKKATSGCSDLDYVQIINSLKAFFEFSDSEKNMILGKSSTLGKKSFNEFIKFISPNNNNFILTTVANYDNSQYGENEVWTDGNCLAIKFSYIDEFASKYIKL